MKNNYQPGDHIVSELRLYLQEWETVHREIRSLAGSIKAHLRSVVAGDIKSHPRLLFIYDLFLKLKDVAEQHMLRKEQLLIPFLGEMTAGEQAGDISHSKAVLSFFKVFSAENDKLAMCLQSLGEATDQYNIADDLHPRLKQSFMELKQLASLLTNLCGQENQLFISIQREKRVSTISKIRRA